MLFLFFAVYYKAMEQQHCFCGKDASQRCSGCQAVFYCSREHQKKDWKQHRINCRAFRVERTLNVGRRLIACRDLKAGIQGVLFLCGCCEAEIDHGPREVETRQKPTNSH